MRIRRDYITGLLLQGMTFDAIAADCQRTFGITEIQTRNAYDAVLDAWSRQSEADAKHARAAVIQRLRSDLVVMRADLAPSAKTGRAKKPKRKVDFKTINAHETLLAKVEGTLRPIEVKVDVDATTRRSLTAIIGSLTGADLDKLVEEERELEAKAAEAKKG